MNINTTITTGNYSIELIGKVEEKDFAKLIEEGVKSRVYRKVFPKTELAMALATGQTTEDAKSKKAVINKGFKRAEVTWDADLGNKVAGIVEGEMSGFKAIVTQYVASTSTSQEAKAKAEYATSLAGLDLAKQFMPEDKYNELVAELKTKHGQD